MHQRTSIAVTITLYVVLAPLVVGCNAILGNEIHDLAAQSSTEPEDATAPDAGNHDAAIGDALARDAAATQDATVRLDTGVGGDGAGTESAAILDAAVDTALTSTATCVPGGDCSSNECASGVWACVDSGRVCQLTPATDGTPCGNATVDAGGHVCSAGQCVACSAGADCSDPKAPCVKKNLDCTNGTPVCKVTGNAAEGIACGASLYCNAGSCAACQIGAACAPAANSCHVGKVTACTGGAPTCSDQGANAPAGTACAAAGGASAVCDGSGTCAPCSPGAQCHPSGNTCQLGTQSCSAGPVCNNAIFIQEGKPCAVGSICHAGACGTCGSSSCGSGCCDSTGCVTALQGTTECGPGAGGGACTACPGPSVGTGSPKCSGNACTFACTGGTPDACPGIGCVDLKSDDANCGQCSNKCGPATHCTAGACVCTPKQSPCGNAVCGSASDGCGKMVTCLPGCTTPLTCDATGKCVNTMCAATCPMGEDCGTLSAPGCTTLTCGMGTCTPPAACVRAPGSTAGTCTCTAPPGACGSRTCGTVLDACGNTVNCLPGCAPGLTCNAGTCCPTSCSGANCGSLSSPGCSPLRCGPGCPPPDVCSNTTGGPGTCMCTSNPQAACGNRQCGQVLDQCNKLVNCPPGSSGTCSAPFVCSASAGTNTCSCPSGLTLCGGTCVNETTNNTPNAANCGGCGAAFACTGSTTCQGGACACPPGFVGCTTSCPSASVSCIKPTAVAVGGAHACALLSTGEVECWGNNSNGQLGASPSNGVATPAPVLSVSGATAIQASSNSSCALLGDIWKCWGDSSFGQLGFQGNVLPPVLVFMGATAFSMGTFATCANVAGSVKCLGDATYGEIGTTNGTASCSGPNSCSLTPRTVPSTLISGVRSLSTSGTSVCALTSGGSVVCWGSDATGQLGQNGAGSTCSQNAVPAMVPCSPAPVLVPGVSNAISVKTGGFFGFACALIQGGTVECWGDNSYGELGRVENAACESPTSTSPCSTSPLGVTGLTNATAIAAGDDFACALLQDGMVDCWGFNGNGNLGNTGVTGSCPAQPSLICSQTPVRVSGVANATAIAAGGDTACALLQSGAVQCWGEAKFGQLGNGTFSGPNTPVNVQW